MLEGFEETTLWDISVPDVARVGVETSAIIAGMALVGQSSTEAMAKEITRLKQSAAQAQVELAKYTKSTSEYKQRSLNELRVALEARHEQEKQQLKETHAHELGELHRKIESTVLEKKET